MNLTFRDRLSGFTVFLRVAVFLCVLASLPASHACGQGLKKTKAPVALNESGKDPASGIEDLQADTTGDYAPPPGSHYGPPEDLLPDGPPPGLKPGDAAAPAATQTQPVPDSATGTQSASPSATHKTDYILEDESQPVTPPPPGTDKLIRTNKPKPVEGGADIEPLDSGPSDTAPEPLTDNLRPRVATPSAQPEPATSAAETPAATGTPIVPASTGTPATPETTGTAPTPAPLPEIEMPATPTLPVPDAATATAPVENTPQSEKPAPESGEGDAKNTSPTIGPIQITGYTEIISQNASTSGGSEYQFLSQNGLLYFDKFRQSTRIYIDGDLENGTKLTGEFVEMPYLDRVFRLSAEHEKYTAHIGDTSAEFESGPMTAFRKQIRGLDLRYDLGAARLDLLFSKQKSKTQDQTFVGRNIRGPYALRDKGLVENTETVRVNGQPLSRSEYKFDYFLGEITFNRVMDPGDIIEVNYESEVWLDLRTGNLFGMSLQGGIMDGKANIGASFLREETDVLPQAQIFSETMETTKLNLYDVGTDSYIFYLGRTRLEKNHELVSARATDTIYLDKDTDFVIDYASGVVTFASASADFAALPDTATITVVFNYYDQDFLQWVQDEELSGDGEIEYILSYERIYGGTEYVAQYEYGTFVRQLSAGQDYEINEGNNSIVFLDASAMPSQSFGRTARISYEIAPETGSAITDSTAERTVQSLFGDINLGAWKLSGEVAQSSSDLRLKTVPVLEELVGIVASATQTEYLLQNEAQYNSVEIYFNDVSAPSARQNSGSDYLIEYDAATGRTRIRFKRDIPVGTTIIANYKYQPDAEYLKTRDGKAGRMVAEYKDGGASFRGELMKKSPMFAPITSYNDLENERVFATLGLADLYNFSLDIDYAHQLNYQNLSSARQTAFDRLKTRLGYKFAQGHSVSYTMETYNRQDNMDTHITDTGVAGRRVDATFKVNETMTTTAMYETRDIDDQTDRTSDRTVQRGSLGLAWDPSAQLRLGITLGSSGLRSTPPIGYNLDPFTIRTFSTQFSARYMPSDTLSVNVDLNKQNIEDTREDAPDGKLDSIRADVFGKGSPFGGGVDGVFKDYLLSYYRQDRPDLLFGDSRTVVATARLTLRAGAQVLVIPSFVATKSSIGTGSQSRDNTAGVRMQYRDGATAGWRAAASYSASSRSGRNVPLSNPSAATSYDSKQNQVALYLDYLTGDKWAWNGIYQNSTSNGSGTFSRTAYTSKLTYLMNQTSTLRMVYNLDQAPSSGDRTTFELGAVTQFDRNMDLDVEYKTQDQSGGGDSDYQGTLFTMKLKINF